jgi:hypothetical protein
MCTRTVSYSECTCGRTWNKVPVLKRCKEAVLNDEVGDCRDGVKSRENPEVNVCSQCTEDRKVKKKSVRFVDDIDDIPSDSDTEYSEKRELN